MQQTVLVLTHRRQYNHKLNTNKRSDIVTAAIKMTNKVKHFHAIFFCCPSMRLKSYRNWGRNDEGRAELSENWERERALKTDTCFRISSCRFAANTWVSVMVSPVTVLNVFHNQGSSQLVISSSQLTSSSRLQLNIRVVVWSIIHNVIWPLI